MTQQDGAPTTGPPPPPGRGFPPPGPVCGLSAAALAASIRDRQLSVREVMDAFLDRIGAINPHLNAIVSLRPRSELMREAEAADGVLAAGAHPGPLFGLPLAVKDTAQTKGLLTTLGSPIHADFVPESDQYFVSRMRQAGAIITGKTNVPEFGLGSHTYNSVFGATRNAYGSQLTAGGSSGGGAAALATNLLPVADGSDMGGSLRNPAAFNNVYGFRPSQGRVPSGPRDEAFLSQMAQVGAMGRHVADIAMLLDVQAGYDAREPLTLGESADFGGRLTPLVEGARIAWMGSLDDHLAIEHGILPLCIAALDRLDDAGALVEELVPDFDFEALWQAFVRLRHATVGSALKSYYDDAATRHLLKAEAVSEVEGALRLRATDVFDASRTRTAWYQHIVSLFEEYDFLALPAAQVFPFSLEWDWPKEIAGRSMDTYHRWMEVCSLATMAGLPAISVPVGFDDRGRSMGMQLVGKPRGDLSVLSMAAGYELRTSCGIQRA